MRYKGEKGRVIIRVQRGNLPDYGIKGQKQQYVSVWQSGDYGKEALGEWTYMSVWRVVRETTKPYTCKSLHHCILQIGSSWSMRCTLRISLSPCL